MPFSCPNLCMFPARSVCMTKISFLFFQRNILNKFVNTNKVLFICSYFGTGNTWMLLENEYFIASSEVLYLGILREIDSLLQTCGGLCFVLDICSTVATIENNKCLHVLVRASALVVVKKFTLSSYCSGLQQSEVIVQVAVHFAFINGSADRQTMPWGQYGPNIFCPAC